MTDPNATQWANKPHPSPQEPTSVGAPPHVVVVLQAYLAGGGMQAKSVRAGWEYRVREDEQPYVRTLTLKDTTPVTLDLGWLTEKAGLVLVKCDSGGPLYLSFSSVDFAHLVVPPAAVQSLGLTPAAVVRMWGPVGTRVTVTAFPG